MIKHPYIRFLKTAGIAGSRVYPRRSGDLPKQSIVVVHEISTEFTYTQEGRIVSRQTRLQTEIFAPTDLEVETIKTAIVDACAPEVPVEQVDNVPIHSIFMEDSGDLMSDEMFQLEIYGGFLESIFIY